ncbi:hypothetical protein ANTRET_LOCUS11134 [Anthophora retusa]
MEREEHRSCGGVRIFPSDLENPGEGHVEVSHRFVPISAAGLQAGRVGLGREVGLADVPGLGEVNGGLLNGDLPGIRARSRALASRGSSLLRGFRWRLAVDGRPLRPPFNARLRTGTD